MTIVFFMGADNDAMNFGCQWEIDGGIAVRPSPPQLHQTSQARGGSMAPTCSMSREPKLRAAKVCAVSG